MKAITLCALVLASAAFAADKPESITKEVSGEAAIVGGDMVRAEKEATDAALRNAVEQVAGVLVSSTTITENSVLVQDQILSHSAGYIRKYDVLSKAADKGVEKVTVRAEVGTAQLDKDLAAVQAMVSRLGHPTMAIVIAEQTLTTTDKGNAITNTDTTQSVLAESFKKDGWTIKDPNWVAGEFKLQPGVTINDSQVKQIADAAKVNYILYGKVILRNQESSYMGPLFQQREGEPPPVYPVTGEYDLTLYATDSGTQLANITGKIGSMKELGRIKTPDISASYGRTAHELISNAKGEILGQVRAKAIESLRDAAQNGNSVLMKVAGLPDFTSAKDFKKSVAAMSAVKSVHENGGFDKGTATFDVVLTGSTDDFALALEKSTFKKKKISVTNASANRVEVVVAK